MQPKPVVITLIILNLILLAVLYLLTQTAILDRWIANKTTPSLCQTQTESGETVFKFCEAEAE